MKIQSIQIQKFRSIDNANISFKQFLALVGANNVGKSHVLRALNAFFNFEDERGYFLNEAHLYSKQSRPKITITFSDITPEDEVDEEYICNPPIGWHEDSKAMECKTTCRRTVP